jgi:hypothetical protein
LIPAHPNPQLQGYNVAKQCRDPFSPLYQIVWGVTMMLYLATTAGSWQKSKLIHEKLSAWEIPGRQFFILFKSGYAASLI